MSRQTAGPQTPIFKTQQGFFSGEKGERSEVCQNLHLHPKLRMSGAILLLLLYIFIECTRTTLLSTMARGEILSAMCNCCSIPGGVGIINVP